MDCEKYLTFFEDISGCQTRDDFVVKFSDILLSADNPINFIKDCFKFLSYIENKKLVSKNDFTNLDTRVAKKIAETFFDLQLLNYLKKEYPGLLSK